jgi:molecular chaperone GrpE (heat shock protein)
MSDEAPADFAGHVAVDAGTHLTPETIETVLNDFRGWLQQAASAAEPAAPADEAAFSWHGLTAEFTALRQEVNLLTRAARTQQEQNAETLRQLGDCVQALEKARAEQDRDDSESLRPLLKTLVDLYDALALARREVQRVEIAIGELLGPDEPQETQDIEPLPPRRWWQWWSRPRPRPGPTGAPEGGTGLGHEPKRAAAQQVRQFFASVVTGYTMSLQRVDRALDQHDLEPIICVGEPFDPEYMEVVEVVSDPERSGTEVLEEVRRGYLWHDRLFRYAQVRVARPDGNTRP